MDTINESILSNNKVINMKQDKPDNNFLLIKYSDNT